MGGIPYIGKCFHRSSHYPACGMPDTSEIHADEITKWFSFSKHFLLYSKISVTSLSIPLKWTFSISFLHDRLKEFVNVNVYNTMTKLFVPSTSNNRFRSSFYQKNLHPAGLAGLDQLCGIALVSVALISKLSSAVTPSDAFFLDYRLVNVIFSSLFFTLIYNVLLQSNDHVIRAKLQYPSVDEKYKPYLYILLHLSRKRRNF